MGQRSALRLSQKLSQPVLNRTLWQLRAISTEVPTPEQSACDAHQGTLLPTPDLFTIESHRRKEHIQRSHQRRSADAERQPQQSVSIALVTDRPVTRKVWPKELAVAAVLRGP
jgi:hypothetical protein